MWVLPPGGLPGTSPVTLALCGCHNTMTSAPAAPAVRLLPLLSCPCCPAPAVCFSPLLSCPCLHFRAFRPKTPNFSILKLVLVPSWPQVGLKLTSSCLKLTSRCLKVASSCQHGAEPRKKKSLEQVTCWALLWTHKAYIHYPFHTCRIQHSDWVLHCCQSTRYSIISASEWFAVLTTQISLK